MKTERPFSIFKGYTYTFEDEGNHIQVWCSAFSGLEKIFVNGDLVLSQRNFSADSSSNFTIGVDEYSTSLQIQSLMKGPFVCTLSKNGNVYKRQRLVFPRVTDKKRKVSFLLRFTAFLLLGFAFGVFKNKFELSDYSTYVFLLIITITVFVSAFLFDNRANPFVEDEELQ